ncbi:MAG: BamA/TamA family outer membrane protein [Proteobacteria bacterium]|nr:BamA/TamA family outer membrane protein [Pseudomonadota bacterium]
MRRFFLAAVIACLCLHPCALCAQADGGADPEVEIRPPGSYYAKRAALFPLELPAYAFKVALFPISEGMALMERKRVFERTAEFLSNKEHTMWVYPIINWGAGDNFGGGAGFKHRDLFGEQYVLGASYTINISLTQHAEASLARDEVFSLWDRPVSFWTGIEWDRVTNADYYGKGSDTPRDDHSRYEIDDIRWEGQLRMGLGHGVEIGASLGLMSALTGPSTYGGYPSVETTFGAASLPGYDRWLTHLKFGLGVGHSTLDDRRRPRRGGLQKLALAWNQCLNSRQLSYGALTFDAEHYFPMWKLGHVFVARYNMVLEQAFGGDQVPFYRLAVLDYRSPLRGFKRGRFRDTSSMLFNFEYLFPVSRMVEGIVFADTGRVFDGLSDFSFDSWKYSAGGGMNLKLFRITLLKFRAAYGGEGVNLMLGMTMSI